VLAELRPGLRRWTTTHPGWNPEEDGLDASYAPVGSVAYRGPDALVLIDALVPDDLWPALDAEVEAADAPVVVLTTIGFHARSRDAVVERYGARVAGEAAGVRPFSAERGDEVAFWLEEPRAVVFGDAVLGDQAGGVRLTPWAKDAAGLERTRQALLPLLDLPVEVVLTAHGEPVLDDGHAALARALTA